MHCGASSCCNVFSIGPAAQGVAGCERAIRFSAVFIRCFRHFCLLFLVGKYSIQIPLAASCNHPTSPRLRSFPLLPPLKKRGKVYVLFCMDFIQRYHFPNLYRFGFLSPPPWWESAINPASTRCDRALVIVDSPKGRAFASPTRPIANSCSGP